MEGLAENGAKWGGFHLVSLEALSGVLVVVNDIVYDILFTCPRNLANKVTTPPPQPVALSPSPTGRIR